MPTPSPIMVPSSGPSVPMLTTRSASAVSELLMDRLNSARLIGTSMPVTEPSEMSRMITAHSTPIWSAYFEMPAGGALSASTSLPPKATVSPACCAGAAARWSAMKELGGTSNSACVYSTVISAMVPSGEPANDDEDDHPREDHAGRVPGRQRAEAFEHGSDRQRSPPDRPVFGELGRGAGDGTQASQAVRHDGTGRSYPVPASTTGTQAAGATPRLTRSPTPTRGGV